MVIDQVLIKVGDGHNMCSLDDWLGRSVVERIDLINSNGVQFLSGGNPVAVREALQAIRAMNA
ncbi:MAG: hypothetical protein IH973_06015 [Myxococcales bacterium]|nr:hypothetical protein [Myxococcales bacterium]